jgi:hypothetical protein
MLGGVVQSNGVNIAGLNELNNAVDIVNSQKHTVFCGYFLEVGSVQGALCLDTAATTESYGIQLQLTIAVNYNSL